MYFKQNYYILYFSCTVETYVFQAIKLLPVAKMDEIELSKDVHHAQVILDVLIKHAEIPTSSSDESCMDAQDVFKYCKTRKFSRDKFLLIRPSKCFRTFNCHYSMAALCCIITSLKVTKLEAFNFNIFSSSVEIVKINHR